MGVYQRLFTWAVIEDELRLRWAANPASFKAHEKSVIKEWRPSRRSFEFEKSTLWRFRDRGDWCVHSSEYRGNWSPRLVRNLILKFSRRGETVLDPFVGGGTTAIECYLEGRNFVGVDVNTWGVRMTRQKISHMKRVSRQNKEYDLPDVKILIRRGDSRDLSFLSNESIHLICAHPPYGDSLSYTRSAKGDLSLIHDIDEFREAMREIAAECSRVLKRSRTCAVLIGDIRKDGKLITLERKVSDEFTKVGFELRERIIKEQFKDKSTAFYLNMPKRGLHWIAHEYLLIFKKAA